MADLAQPQQQQPLAQQSQQPHQLQQQQHQQPPAVPSVATTKKPRSRNNRDNANKRRCVSTACIACRRRKSKCDGNTPACAACSSVYNTECIYDPNSDHRRKGVYKEKVDSLKTRNSTLQTLIQAILNAAEDDVPALVQQIRTCENLDDVADAIMKQEQGIEDEDDDDDLLAPYSTDIPTFEGELSGKMGELRLENGSVRFIGGTSNLIYLSPTDDNVAPSLEEYQHQDQPILSWTTVTSDSDVILHLLNMYFTWHYPYFTTLSKELFYNDFVLGRPPANSKRTVYCSSLLVNAMLALGCHFTNSPTACSDPDDPTTKGDAFFQEAKRLIVENDEYEKPRLTTVQALALMSVREAGCGREAKGWVYSGMSFRMALDMGLNLNSGGITANKETMNEKEIDARRITFWGCFLFDKCWSNYLGRLPQLPLANITVQKYDVFPDEDAGPWSPYTDNGVGHTYSQPARTRAVALQISSLCEISSDLLIFFYHPHQIDKHVGKSAELKKLSEIHTRLEAWRKDLPKELEPKEGQLPNVILMHMFFHLLYIHLFRPFFKYNPSTSPLPSHVSPRKICTQAASLISKLMRLYKRTYGLRQICNIAVYMVHSACTIHLLNLPGKTARRDIMHGVKHLEEIAEDWLCARRTLSIISVLARKWHIDLPYEAATVLQRTDAKYGVFSTADVPSPKSDATSPMPMTATSSPRPLQSIDATSMSAPTAYYSMPPANSGLNSVNLPSAIPLYNAQQMPIMTPAPSPRPSSTLSLPPEPSVQMATPYERRQYSMVPPQAAAQPTQPNHSVPGTSSATLSRQTSPGTVFGNVDALADSQDWWLRDQVDFAAGFGNWNGIDMQGLSGPGGAGPNSGNAELFPGAGAGIGNVNGAGNGVKEVVGDDEWF